MWAKLLSYFFFHWNLYFKLTRKLHTTENPLFYLPLARPGMNSHSHRCFWRFNSETVISLRGLRPAISIIFLSAKLQATTTGRRQSHPLRSQDFEKRLHYTFGTMKGFSKIKDVRIMLLNLKRDICSQWKKTLLVSQNSQSVADQSLEKTFPLCYRESLKFFHKMCIFSFSQSYPRSTVPDHWAIQTGNIFPPYFPLLPPIWKKIAFLPIYECV